MDIENNSNTHCSLQPSTALNLSNVTKTIPMVEEATPRWLLTLLPWVQAESGVYTVNKRKRLCDFSGKTQVYNNKDCMEVDADGLCCIPPFKYLEKSLIEKVIPYFVMEQYDAGTTVTKRLGEGERLFLVGKGKVEVTTEGAQREKLNIGILADGDHTNIDAFIQRSNMPINITALTPCVLFSLQRSDFEAWVNHSNVSREAFNAAIQRWLQDSEGANEYGEKLIDMFTGNLGEHNIPCTFPDYEEVPCQYKLNVIQTILRTNTQVTDVFNSPHNQLNQQMRITMESMKEKQEWEIINNKEFGLLNSAAPSMRIQTRKRVPTPDAMDELLAHVWKKPAFFLANPKAIAAFGRECTKRGVPPATVNFCGSPFMTWRGVPIVPCDKLLVDGRSRHKSSHGTTNILLMRVGEQDQGVVGLHQTGIPDECHIPGMSVKFAGIDNMGITSYLLSLYFSAAVLTDDALGVLEDVEVGCYYDYE